MAKELDAILDHGEAYVAKSCEMENGSVSFLEKVICPIYETLAKVVISLWFHFLVHVVDSIFFSLSYFKMVKAVYTREQFSYMRTVRTNPSNKKVLLFY